MRYIISLIILPDNSSPIETLFEKFKTSVNGLPDAEAQERLKKYGYNEPAKKKKRSAIFQILLRYIHPKLRHQTPDISSLFIKWVEYT